MDMHLLSGLFGFAFVSSITPGPNNLMLMASGANFGLRRSLRHMIGVGGGFVLMVLLVGLGVAGLFELWPASTLILKVFSVIYMFWLAWKIARAAPPKEGQEVGQPLGFLQAALFQWVNPKAWAMALTATTVYSADRSLASVALVAVIFGLINLPCIGSWTLLGQEMRRFLSSPARLRAFNYLMAALLIASLYPVLRG